MPNLFENLPAPMSDEVFTELLLRPGVRIERIVSNGQITPIETPFDQDHDEWVLLLRGSASLWVEGTGERDLAPGDHVLIPAHRLHRVTRTATNEPTIWLAIHFASAQTPPDPGGVHKLRDANTGGAPKHDGADQP